MRPTLTGFKRLCTAGTVIRCVENTYRPELNGTTRTIIKPSGTSPKCEFNGESFWMAWPKASDVIEVTDSQIKYRLPHREGHTVELEVID